MEKVQNYITENKERFLEELFDLLRIPSISAQSEHKPDMVKCAEWLAAALVKSGADRAEVMPTDGNPVVYAEKIIDPAAKTVSVTNLETGESFIENYDKLLLSPGPSLMIERCSGQNRTALKLPINSAAFVISPPDIFIRLF